MRLTLVILALLGVAAERAEAYPEFQFSTGTARCSACHFAPVGGGLINDYGRDEAATTISDAGDGRFAHGLVELPAWIALGADVRVASFAKRVRGGSEATVFPMQADVYARLAWGGLTVNATGGVLGAIREPAPFAERLGSREHYVMYQPESRAWYVRAGRFFPTLGLRLPDHTAYVRRYTGLHSLEESYGVSAGRATDRWELHGTLLTPLEVHPVAGHHDWGGALHAEHINEAETQLLAVHGKAVRTSHGVETWVGGSWKRWHEGTNLLFAAELHAGTTSLTPSPVARLAGYAALHYRPGKAWGLAGAAHYFDADLRLIGHGRSALEMRGSWFPRAHLEAALLIRGESVGAEVGRGNVLGFLQLHYYL
ncbi:MAG: hypothetical protein H0X17_17505 [Deltaproteobacteria bacterium]|nr:hypothetical protein [Deltaproteobacteria bacterium]